VAHAHQRAQLRGIHRDAVVEKKNLQKNMKLISK